MRIILSLMVIFFLGGCGGATVEPIEDDEQVGSLPRQIIEPENNISNNEKNILGKLLFWDPILSGNQDVACATCHHPDHGYAENRDLSLGVNGQGLSESREFGVLIKRNAPTIINTAYNGIDEDGEYDPLNTVMFWDNRSSSLEDQALEPIKSEAEMRGDFFAEDDIIAEVSQRLANNSEYVMLFTNAFGDGLINGERIAMALAAFQRSIVSNDSRFDRYARGDDGALSEQEIRGLNAFVDAGCGACHGGPMFSDFDLHELPVPDNEKLVAAGIQDEGEAGQFRTPSLRNVALTAPYMHNGTVRTLNEAIEFYDDIENPGNDPDLAALEFDDVEAETVEAIAAFLRALTDESFDKEVPVTVPSGLMPGGNI